MQTNDTSKLSKKRFFIILFLVLIGIALCSELGVIFYKTNYLTEFSKSFCAISDLIDCDGVALTKYSMTLGVPNALWGFIIYSIIFFLLFVDKIQAKFKNTIFDVFENPRSYITTLAMFQFVASIILAVSTIFIIKKICTLCYCTYAIDLLIALVARQNSTFINDIKTTIKDFIKGAKKYFVLFIIVVITVISTLIYLDRSLVLSPKLKKEKTQKEFFEAKYNKYAVKGNELGKKDAKVKIVVYSDFNCPFCKILNIMLHKLAQKENITVEEINFPLDTTCNTKIGRSLPGHETSCFEAQLALAGRNQGKFWDIANVLYYKHSNNPQAIFGEVIANVKGLDVEKLKNDMFSEEIQDELQREIESASAINLLGTPALEIDGVLYMGGMPYEELVQKIKSAQKRIENNNKI